MKVAGCNDEYASSLKLDSQIPQQKKKNQDGCEEHRRDNDEGGGGLLRTGR
ncbi:hypothetical protein Bca4012_090198 [Brassica carinata]